MAYYDFKKKPALTTKEGEKDVLYPSIVFNGTINTKQLLKQLVARTGYKPGVVEGTLMELVDLVGEYIGQGYRVEVGEFGYFSGKIKSRLVKDKKDLRSLVQHIRRLFPNIASITCPPHIKQIPLLHNFHYPLTTKQLFSYRKTNSFL